MSFLRNLLPRGRGSPDCVSRSAELIRWLESLAAVKPAETGRIIADQIRDIRAGGANAWDLLHLLDTIRDKAEHLVPALEEQLLDVSLPLSESPRIAFESASRLLEELAAGYAEVATAMASRWAMRSASRPVRPPLIQAMRFTARRIALGYRIYANGTDPGWLDLHRLYALAREAGFASSLLGSEENPEHIYLKALLLAFAEPTCFVAGELPHVQQYVDRYAHLAEIISAVESERVDMERACFLIQASEPRSGRSLRKWKPEKVAPGDWALRCERLIRKLDAQIAGLESHVAPPVLGLPKVATGPQYLAMLKSLRTHWGMPAARRHKRQRAYPRAAVLAGFAAVWDHLSARGGEALPARQGDAGLPEASEWVVHNESPEGFALRYVGGDTSRIRVGELVFLGQRHMPGGQLCVVRRLLNQRADGLELGVQVASSRGLAATVTLRKSDDAQEDQKERIVVLPGIPAHGDAPGVLAPIGRVSSGARFSALSRGETTVLRIGRRLEQLASCELFTLEQVPV